MAPIGGAIALGPHRPIVDHRVENGTQQASLRAQVPALVRLARIVHAADIESELHTDPAGPGLLAIGLGGLDVEADDHRLLERAEFVYDALYAWCAKQVATQPA